MHLGSLRACKSLKKTCKVEFCEITPACITRLLGTLEYTYNFGKKKFPEKLLLKFYKLFWTQVFWKNMTIVRVRLFVRWEYLYQSYLHILIDHNFIRAYRHYRSCLNANTKKYRLIQPRGSINSYTPTFLMVLPCIFVAHSKLKNCNERTKLNRYAYFIKSHHLSQLDHRVPYPHCVHLA